MHDDVVSIRGGAGKKGGGLGREKEGEKTHIGEGKDTTILYVIMNDE